LVNFFLVLSDGLASLIIQQPNVELHNVIIICTAVVVVEKIHVHVHKNVLFTLNKTVSLVSDVAATTTKTSQSSILMLCVCQTLIKPLLTYLLISEPGIPGSRDWKFLNPGFWD